MTDCYLHKISSRLSFTNRSYIFLKMLHTLVNYIQNFQIVGSQLRLLIVIIFFCVVSTYFKIASQKLVGNCQSLAVQSLRKNGECR